MTSSLAKVNKSASTHFLALFLKFPNLLTFFNIQIDLLILTTYDGQFTLTTKKSLHIIFKHALTSEVMSPRTFQRRPHRSKICNKSDPAFRKRQFQQISLYSTSVVRASKKAQLSLIGRAHSLPRNILPNSADQFSKFRCRKIIKIPRLNRSLPFTFILLDFYFDHSTLSH